MSVPMDLSHTERERERERERKWASQEGETAVVAQEIKSPLVAATMRMKMKMKMKMKKLLSHHGGKGNGLRVF